MRCVLVLVAAAVAAAAPVRAQQQGPEEPTIAEVEPARARVGDTVDVRGTGWEPGSRIEISHQRRPLAFATVRPDGRWEAGVRVPSADPPTTIEVTVSGTAVTGETTTLEVSLDVAPGMPRGIWIVVGGVALVVLLVLALGWAMLARQRRRSITQRVAEGQTPSRNPDPRREPQPHVGRR
ncbi:MAG TPA: hypothetical protein VF058_11360 [Actinomycetota bacterium]